MPPNPKAALFAFSFFPQFLPRHGPVFGTAAALAAVQIVIEAATAWLSCCWRPARGAVSRPGVAAQGWPPRAGRPGLNGQHFGLSPLMPERLVVFWYQSVT